MEPPTNRPRSLRLEEPPATSLEVEAALSNHHDPQHHHQESTPSPSTPRRPSPVPPCTRRASEGDRVDFRAGELKPKACRANFCPHCGVVKSWWIARAVGESSPEVMITLTQAGDTFSEIGTKMTRLIRYLRAAGPVEWAWVVEQNADASMRHVHALVHGTVPDRATSPSGRSERGSVGRSISGPCIGAVPGTS